MHQLSFITSSASPTASNIWAPCKIIIKKQSIAFITVNDTGLKQNIILTTVKLCSHWVSRGFNKIFKKQAAGLSRVTDYLKESFF